MGGAGRYRYLGLQRHLCAQCAAQLAGASSRPASTNLCFVGPVLVRSEGGYHVLSLPHRVKVIVGELADKDCREFAAAIHAETPAPGGDENDWRADGWLKEDVIREPERMRGIFTRAKADPDELVQRVGSRWWAQAWAQAYCARGEFSNAVNICREAVRANPEDDWSYNQLAWIKAACPEPSVRDGKEAVSAATKACELTRWKEWNWIDTLAAACAEAGDFKRAIEFEEQALRAGKPSEPDRNAMQERLLLYKRSQPFRDKP
jgi:tetratricopeptide (TPR) repeat protein